MKNILLPPEIWHKISLFCTYFDAQTLRQTKLISLKQSVLNFPSLALPKTIYYDFAKEEHLIELSDVTSFYNTYGFTPFPSGISYIDINDRFTLFRSPASAEAIHLVLEVEMTADPFGAVPIHDVMGSEEETIRNEVTWLLDKSALIMKARTFSEPRDMSWLRQNVNSMPNLVQWYY